MIKRIVSGLTALAMILSSSFVSEFADGQLLSSTVITADAASDKDFDVNMYIADLMVQDGNPQELIVHGLSCCMGDSYI